MSRIESRIRAIARAAANVPDPADPRLLIPEQVRAIIFDPVQFEAALLWDAENLGDSPNIGVTDDSVREKDKRAFARLLSETAKPFSERN